ncbi:HD domain-containing protein [Roseiconus lacunae]|uniref:HD domain-containing protein n=1 Tax=Roseiconus lacunae TaxID=2605694 RepID=A0ABT7PNY1_9BACT|nr:HD domain-containing protein [Roseiconus lacunae]MCD0462557.1 HD domain-containing protein [Roseiconus lacunae]MDM4017989.1 HD domain-containing protein [Roseiconus lacunae]
MPESNLISIVRREVSRRLSGQGAGHDMDHIDRVVSTAKVIQSREGGDPLVIELAALLHDVGDAKFHDGVERSGEFSREILEKMMASNGSMGEPMIRHIVQIVENISFRKRAEASPLSLEGQVVQDADRLDALGAIGIVRTIEYGAVKGQCFFDPKNPHAKSGVSHFYEKLFRLRSLMNTETGRQMAVRREQFMQNFLRQFYDECGLESQSAIFEADPFMQS